MNGLFLDMRLWPIYQGGDLVPLAPTWSPFLHSKTQAEGPATPLGHLLLEEENGNPGGGWQKLAVLLGARDPARSHFCPQSWRQQT